ncbi:MAG TPA: ABC transporter permease, partial [Casimicrobiaceae bacterium]
MRRWHDNPTLRRAVALILLLALWETASDLKWVNPFYASSPSAVAKVLFSLFADGQIWPHLEATFSAAIIGLVAGLAIGIVLGFVAALTPLLAQLIEPVMILLNAIPRVILAPLFVIWLGI